MKQVLIISALTAALVGCGSDSSSTKTSMSKGTPSVKPTGKCPSNMTCNFLDVPKDYDSPDGEQVKVFYGIQKAKKPSERIGVLIFNFGGPGGEAVSGAGDMAARELPQEIVDKFDIVGIDPRGTGYSAYTKELAACSDKSSGNCDAEYKQFGHYLGTNTLIKDIDSLRKALKEDKINFLGYSYGTRVGSLYAEMFPDNVRALILDSAMPPQSESAIDLVIEENKGKDIIATQRLETSARKTFLEKVVADVMMSGMYSDADGKEIHKDHLVALLQYLVAKDATGAWDGIKESLFRFTDSNQASGLITALDSASARKSAVSSIPSYSKSGEQALFKAVVCTDARYQITTADVENAKESLLKASKLYGPISQSMLSMCVDWAGERDPMANVANMDTKLHGQKVLVIGGKLDDATPYQWSEEMHAAFGRNSVLMTVENLVGHGFAYSNIKCLDDKVTAYLIDPKLDHKDATCDGSLSHSYNAFSLEERPASPIDNIPGILDRVLKTK